MEVRAKVPKQRQAPLSPLDIGKLWMLPEQVPHSFWRSNPWIAKMRRINKVRYKGKVDSRWSKLLLGLVVNIAEAAIDRLSPLGGVLFQGDENQSTHELMEVFLSAIIIQMRSSTVKKRLHSGSAESRKHVPRKIYGELMDTDSFPASLVVRLDMHRTVLYVEKILRTPMGQTCLVPGRSHHVDMTNQTPITEKPGSRCSTWNSSTGIGN